MSIKSKEREEALDTLRRSIADGDTVYCILRSRARSGVSRQIGVVVFKDGQDWHPNWAVSKAVGYALNKHGDGVRINGCGMDMGFALVDDIRAVLGYKKLLHRWL